jgi:hypothetical protein
MSAPLDDLMGNALAEPLADVPVEDSDDIEISVLDDRPEEDQVSPRDPDRSDDASLDEEISNLGGRAGKRINQLRYEYHEQRRAKESAEKMRDEAVRFAQSANNQNGELRNLLQRGEQVLLSEIQSRTESQLSRARDSYRGAHESGDTDAILAAQEALTRSQYESEMAASYGPVVDPSSMPPPAPPPQPSAPQRTPDPKLAEWLGRNPWFGKDEEMTSFAYGVHEKLVRKDGVDPQSDEYYKHINARMREVFPNQFASGGGEGEPAVSSRSSTVVAPARRAGGTPRKVQLTSTQVALAKRLGITPQQYAKQLLKDNQNG